MVIREGLSNGDIMKPKGNKLWGKFFGLSKWKREDIYIPYDGSSRGSRKTPKSSHKGLDNGIASHWGLNKMEGV